jgi:hypothetical protein
MSQCPCGLTFEFLDKHNLVGPGGVCTAFDAKNQPCGRRLVDHPHAPADKSVNDDGTRRVCGEDLLDHPYAPAGHSIHFIFLFLTYFFSEHFDISSLISCDSRCIRPQIRF